MALAQHSYDNVVISAEDAFGITIGDEAIGLYSPDEVRGFSPQLAGNARVGGLFFDQRAPLSSRVLEGSTIRVGMSAIGYPFPAPTGIADYDLRHVGDEPALTAALDAGPYDAWGADLDGQYPIPSRNLRIPVGISYRIAADLPGSTVRAVSVGAAPQWTPRDGLTVRAFWDWREESDAKTAPLIFMAEPGVPPRVPAKYLGQGWANGKSLLETYGATVDARLSRNWSLAAGVFRSTNDSPTSYGDLYDDTQRSGIADHLLIGYPEQRASSTSGELRVTGQFGNGPRRHELVLSVRGRDVAALYDGADERDAGEAVIGQENSVPRPDFTYSARTGDENQLWNTGIAYQGRWVDRGELSVGVQKATYRRTVSAPGHPTAHRTDQPWLVYGIAAVTLSQKTSLYAGYTQGIEDSGIAPSNASNRGEILPATRTWQRDAGVQYALTPTVKLVAGVFDVHKPYYNLDASNRYVDLGDQRNHGLEFSVAGEVTRNLTVVAGLEVLDAEVTAKKSVSTPIGNHAVGQYDHFAQINVDYRLQTWPAVSLDLALYSYGRRAASLDNTVTLPATGSIDLGARYFFALFRAPASLRLLVQNVSNVYSWELTDTAGFSPSPPRSVQIRVTADF